MADVAEAAVVAADVAAVADMAEIVAIAVDTAEIVATEVTVSSAAVDAEEDVVVDAGIAATDTKLSLQQLIHCLERQDLVYLGTVSPETTEDFLKYQAWLTAGNHGSLTYLEQNPNCRKSAHGALSSVQSVIVFGFPYLAKDSYPFLLNEKPRVAAYAQMPDYHRFMKQKAETALAEWKKQSSLSGDWRVCVDTVPLLERAFAKKTGTGFIGKNTCFIHETRGSFLLLGEILTSLPFPKLEKNGNLDCGSCTLCQVECPTGALKKDYQLDATKCLSYWTIEQQGSIPEEFWPGVGKYWFGCDICQLVCPYNREAPQAKFTIPSIELPPLFEVATMDEARYQKFFGGTPLTRAKRNGLRRNALVAMTVNRDPRLAEALKICENDQQSPIRETLLQIKNYLAKEST